MTAAKLRVCAVIIFLLLGYRESQAQASCNITGNISTTVNLGEQCQWTRNAPLGCDNSWTGDIYYSAPNMFNCDQGLIRYWADHFGINTDNWPSGWGIEPQNQCDINLPAARTYLPIFLLYVHPEMRPWYDYVHYHVDEIEPECNDSYTAYTAWRPLLLDPAHSEVNLYLPFFNLSVPQRAAVLAHEARHVDGSIGHTSCQVAMNQCLIRGGSLSSQECADLLSAGGCRTCPGNNECDTRYNDPPDHPDPYSYGVNVLRAYAGISASSTPTAPIFLRQRARSEGNQILGNKFVVPPDMSIDEIPGVWPSCPPGQEYDYQSGSCVLCGPGQFKGDDSDSCQVCHATGRSNANRTSCICPQGFLGNATADTSNCPARAPAGSTTDEGGSTFVQCQPGEGSATAPDAAGRETIVCKSCASEFDPRDPWPGRHFSLNSGSSTCEACPGDTVANWSGTGCTCPLGQGQTNFIGVCRPCTGREISVFRGEQRECSECAPGTIAVDGICEACSERNLLGVISGRLGDASACTSGFFQLGNSCACCPAGRIPNAVGDACLCPPPYWDNNGNCEACPAGRRPDPGGQACICLSGHRENQGDCEACPAGSIVKDNQCVSCESLRSTAPWSLATGRLVPNEERTECVVQDPLRSIEEIERGIRREIEAPCPRGEVRDPSSGRCLSLEPLLQPDRPMP